MASARSRLGGRVSGTDFGMAVLAVAVGALAAGGLFVWLGTRGPVVSIESAVGSIALEVAGANRLFAVGYFGVGMERLYLTAGTVLAGLAGVAVGLTGRWWSVPVAVLCGVAAAGTVTVLSGCTCGSGSTTLLAERAIQRVLSGTASLA
jgi:O-antigen ligase